MAHSVKCFPKIHIKSQVWLHALVTPAQWGDRNRQIDPRGSLAGKPGLIYPCQVPMRDPVFENQGGCLLENGTLR